MPAGGLHREDRPEGEGVVRKSSPISQASEQLEGGERRHRLLHPPHNGRGMDILAVEGTCSLQARIDAIAKDLTTKGGLKGEQGDVDKGYEEKERSKGMHQGRPIPGEAQQPPKTAHAKDAARPRGVTTPRDSSTEESESSVEEEVALKCVDEINQGMDEPAASEERGVSLILRG
jgi:hypothetical protein